MSNKKETVSYTLIVAFLLCLVSSVIVATFAVKLKPTQQENALLFKQRSIVSIAGLDKPGMSAKDIQNLFKTKIEARLVELKTGTYSDKYDPHTYDGVKAAADLNQSRALTADEDIASIHRLEYYEVVYLVKDDQGKLQSIVLPIRGYGLWGTLYGFIALANDFNTVVGLGFYDHKETPGLGGEVDNPKWKALWPGKKVYKDGKLEIRVKKHGTANSDAGADYNVDGLAGATLTTHGVNNLVHFWLSKEGFGPYIANMRGGM